VSRASRSICGGAAELHVITCEYPPDVGGVADHTRALAGALAASGVDVHVWCPPASGAPVEARGLMVHVLPDRYGPRAMRALQHGLDQARAPRRILLQWVPHGYGRRSLNIAFCAWVLRRARTRGDRVEILVHEPYLAFDRKRLRQTGAALVHRVMLTTLFAAAARVWLATPSFEPLVRPYGLGRRLGYGWLPLPSPLVRTSDSELVARVGARWRAPVAAYFGAFGPLVTATLAEVIARVLAVRHDVTWLLIGRDGDRFARELSGRSPGLADRLVPTGTLDADALSAHVLAADVFVQPYPDGITTRRTSATTLLAHGRAIVTTDGYLTEPFWRADGGVRLAPAGDAAALADTTLRLLDDPGECARLGLEAQRLFDGCFSTARAVAALRADV
jgi:glycosyltransferase involved in cell wall biosynthesis